MAKKVKIMLDAGHYGNYYNKGAVEGYYESNMTWELQGYLKSELESYGFEVGTTRKDKAKDLAVVDRGLASEGYDLFLSLHSNAASAPSADYVALFYLVDDKTTNVDTVSKLVAKKLAPVIADLMQTKQKYQVLTRAVDFDRDGDGQLNDNYYGVLHGADLADTAGVIIEHGFHTNPDSCRWLMDSNNLKKLAVEEAKIIAELWGLKKPATTPEPPVVEQPKPEVVKPVEPTPVVPETPAPTVPETPTPVVPETPKEEEPKEEPKVETPVVEQPKVEAPKVETPVIQKPTTNISSSAVRNYYVQCGAYLFRYYAEKQIRKLRTTGAANINLYRHGITYVVGIGPYYKGEAEIVYKTLNKMRIGCHVTKNIGKLIY